MANSVGKVIRSINKNGLNPVYFLLGNDFFLQKFFIKNIKTNYKDFDSIKYLDLSDNNDFIFLINELKVVSMFSSKNIFAIRNFQNISKNNQNLLELYVEKPNKDNILIFMLNGFKISNKFSKNISSKSIIVDIQTPFYDNKIKEWVNFYVKSNNLEISYNTLEFLINNYSDDLENIFNEIEKKYLFDRSKKINLYDNAGLYCTKQYKIWNLIDTIGNKDLKQSMKIYNNLLFNGVSLIPIIINLTNFFIYLTDNKQSSFIINKIITSRISIYCKNYNKNEILNIILDLRNMDILIKSTSIKDEALILPFLVKVCKGHYGKA